VTKPDPGNHFPPGHFYSPVVDLALARRDESRIWPKESRLELPGIDLNPEGHRRLLEDVFTPLLKDFDFPEEHAEPGHYYLKNGLFSNLDARVYFCLLRHLKPARVMEIGSGHSTMLCVETARRFLGGKPKLTCVEPYPADYLSAVISGYGAELITTRVQDVSADRFAVLQSGDILFIDSAHVSKLGSDVNYLFFEILPRLAEGVYVHVHDIFLPDDYPRKWVFEQNRSWNEQYLLQAFLMFNQSFKVIFGNNFAQLRWPQQVASACGRRMGGGSFWIQKQSWPPWLDKYLCAPK
jgi:hypothetical protein